MDDLDDEDEVRPKLTEIFRALEPGICEGNWVAMKLRDQLLRSLQVGLDQDNVADAVFAELFCHIDHPWTCPARNPARQALRELIRFGCAYAEIYANDPRQSER